MINWAAVAAICSMLGLIVMPMVLSYQTGRMTQEMKETKANLLEVKIEHGAKLEIHAARLNDHEVKLGRLSEWKNGFNAAAQVSGGRQVE